MAADPLEQDEPTDPGIDRGALAAAASTRASLPSLGALDPLMRDPSITEIMVNDLRNVMVEREGKMTFANVRISEVDELNRITRLLCETVGRYVTPESPYLDAMLPDGSRVNIVGPPLTTRGPCITIRKFPAHRLGPDELVASGMLDRRMSQFLQACVVGRLNVVVSGGTGSGKTTLLSALASFIPQSERVVTIEDTPEISLPHVNSVSMQTKPQPQPVGARELVANALRMRPDRILVGECRRGEAFDMLQAMNTGHAGSMTTLHANSPRDALARIETLSLMSGVELPLSAVRRQLASAVDLVVQVKRFRTGKRRVTAISEITGMEGEVVTMQDIFTFELPAKAAPDMPGRFRATGFVPTFVDRLREAGVEFPPGFFA